MIQDIDTMTHDERREYFVANMDSGLARWDAALQAQINAARKRKWERSLIGRMCGWLVKMREKRKAG